MDRTRMIVLAVAAGGTSPTAAAPGPRVVMSDVLVAAGDLTPGSQLTPASVHWQEWPKTSVNPVFITRDSAPDVSKIVQGAVVRAPMMAGEPLTASKIVHADAAGFLAAMLMPGMRAVSIAISVDTGAGGFILPNDRVDILCTQQVGDAHRYRTTTILNDVRVLAVDQTYESKDTKTVVARTATLELTPDQVELVERAKAGATLSLALRALGDGGAAAKNKVAAAAIQQNSTQANSNEVDVFRYGIMRPSVVGSKE
ncbi:MAG: Flp pilus assembly protein CpaB [Verrucomicrobia bacterium]|nr:MAG: Flp pilus assembly protein CpaB [Verrucomicrobiota bacterium]